MDDETAVGAGGPGEPPEPAHADSIAGVLVTETFDYDGDRQVTAYVPRDAPQAVVFAGDVVTTERVGSHGDAFWREELPLMVAWAYGR